MKLNITSWENINFNKYMLLKNIYILCSDIFGDELNSIVIEVVLNNLTIHWLHISLVITLL